MNISKLINSLSERVRKSRQRFQATLAFSGILTLFICYLIIVEDDGEESFFIGLGLIVATFISLLLKVIDENLREVNNAVTYGVSALAGVITYLAIKLTDQSLYCAMAIVGVILLTICIIMYSLYRNHDERKMFPHLFRSAFFSVMVNSVRFGGIIIALLAFHYLLVEIDDLFEKILPILFVLFECFGLYVIFISYLPNKDDEVKSFRAYDIIVSKVGLWVYLLLIAILYGYIIKIIVTWSMPVGRLNWFGSLALLFYVFFYLNVDEESGILQRLFVRYGGLMLLPVVGVQLFAIYIRVHAYGLTTLRYVSLLLIGGALLFVFNSIIRKKISLVFIGMAVIVVIGLMSPLNIIDVPNMNQEARLKRVFRANGMLDGNKVINYGKEVPSEDAEKIVSGLEYFGYPEGRVTEFVSGLKDLDPAVYYSSGQPSTNYEYHDFFCENKEISVEGFSTAEMRYDYLDNSEADYLKDYFTDLVANYGQGSLTSDIMTYDRDDNTRMVFTNIHLTYNDGVLEYVSIEYYLLRR